MNRVTLVKALFAVVIGSGMSMNTAQAEAPAPSLSTTTSTATTSTLVPQETMNKWALVAQCETHQNWSHPGPYYQGGLGITPWNWLHYGGGRFAPHAFEATPQEQVWVAIHIQINNGVGSYVPDQKGTCDPW
jgi:hypothetical protein